MGGWSRSERQNVKEGVSIIIPAYNEEKNIRYAIEAAKRGLKGAIADYEIIVFDDGSRDKTAEVVLDFIKRRRLKNVKLFRHKKNMGLGYTLWDGIKKATKAYYVGFPGDYDTSEALLRDLIKNRKRADIISSYMSNPQVRSIQRRVVSGLFVHLVNLLFRTNLKYYNGYYIARVSLLRSIPIKSKGFSTFSEVKLRLLYKGATLKEIPFKHITRKYGTTKALSWANMKDLFTVIFRLFFDLRIRPNI